MFIPVQFSSHTRSNSKQQAHPQERQPYTPLSHSLFTALPSARHPSHETDASLSSRPAERRHTTTKSVLRCDNPVANVCCARGCLQVEALCVIRVIQAVGVRDGAVEEGVGEEVGGVQVRCGRDVVDVVVGVGVIVEGHAVIAIRVRRVNIDGMIDGVRVVVDVVCVLRELIEVEKIVHNRLLIDESGESGCSVRERKRKASVCWRDEVWDEGVGYVAAELD